VGGAGRVVGERRARLGAVKGDVGELEVQVAQAHIRRTSLSGQYSEIVPFCGSVSGRSGLSSKKAISRLVAGSAVSSKTTICAGRRTVPPQAPRGRRSCS
jgi:hypothetical protein